MKTELCQSNGYRLIHIWEDEWDAHRELIKEKLSKIFTNTEQINFNSILDRSWFPLKQINGYQIQILPPQIIIRNKFKVENCGYIKYIKI